MKFIALIYHGTAPVPGSEKWKTLPPEEQKAIYAGYAEMNRTTGVTPGLALGYPHKARTVQVRDGKPVVKSGTHLTEGVAGYAIIEAETVDDAVALAARFPAARLGGAVEVRPSEQYW